MSEAAATVPTRRSTLGRMASAAREDPVLALSACVCVIVILLIVIGPLLAPIFAQPDRHSRREPRILKRALAGH